MKEVPITRFRREIRKWIRSGENLSITRNGKAIFVFLNVNTYNVLVKQLKNSS